MLKLIKRIIEILSATCANNPLKRRMDVIPPWSEIFFGPGDEGAGRASRSALVRVANPN